MDRQYSLADLCILKDGAFQPVNQLECWFSRAVDGLMTFMESPYYHNGTFHAIQTLGCFHCNLFRWLPLRFRLATTTTNGVLVFKFKSTMTPHHGQYSIPDSHNTITVIRGQEEVYGFYPPETLEATFLG